MAFRARVDGFGFEGPVPIRIVLEVGCFAEFLVIGARSFAEMFGHKGWACDLRRDVVSPDASPQMLPRRGVQPNATA